jgi:hypothetical protein
MKFASAVGYQPDLAVLDKYLDNGGIAHSFWAYEITLVWLTRSGQSWRRRTGVLK